MTLIENSPVKFPFGRCFTENNHIIIALGSKIQKKTYLIPFGPFLGTFGPILAHFVDPRIFPKFWHKKNYNSRTVHDLRQVEPILETRQKGGEHNLKGYDSYANCKNRFI